MFCYRQNENRYSWSCMENITFEEAIAYTEDLLSRSDLDDAQLESQIAALVQTANGARGFFVCFLTGEWQLADAPSTAVIRALQSTPQAISELLVKNLVMSTAMAMTHRRAGNTEQAEGSDRVAKRTALLIEKVDLLEVRAIETQVHDAALANTGEYVSFFDKWGYDAEQKQAIANVLDKILDKVSANA
jgi:hypothetical protein